MAASLLIKVLTHVALITAVEWGWDRSQEIRKTWKNDYVRREAPYLYSKLQRAYMNHLIDFSEYSHWRQKLWDAEKENDCEDGK